MAADLGHSQSVGVEYFVGPVAQRLFKDCLVEDVVVSKECILTAETRIVFEKVVDIKLVKCEEGGIGLWVGNDCLCPHELCQTRIEVESVAQPSNNVCLGQVAAICKEFN